MADPNEQQAKIRADFTRTAEASQELLGLIEKNIAAAEATGNEVELVRLRAQRAAVTGYRPQEPATIDQANAAIERQNRLQQMGLDQQLQSLELLKAQANARRAAAADLASYGASGYRVGGSHASLAGSQVAAEEQLAAGAAARAAIVLPPEVTRGQEAAAAQAERAAAAQQAEATAARAAAEAAQRKAIAERQALDAMAAEEERQRQITREEERQAFMREQYVRNARVAGFQATAGYQPYQEGERSKIMAGGVTAAQFAEAQQAENRFALSLGEYEGYASRAGLATNALTTDLTRLGMVQAEESNAMRAHGALTTEWLSALARGETTVSEFGYQIGATVGKFAGWTAAAAATYGVLGAVAEFGKGAIDSANGVGQLKRTIDNLDTQKAAQDIRSLSQGTDVSVKEAGDAVFAFSRTFHNLPDAVRTAHDGLGVFQLDNVKLSDSVRLATSLTTQWGLSMTGLHSIFDMLSAGQREYNARLSDMIPLVQTASGAVHTAGGDLNQLVQLGTVASRLSQLGGSRIGTAFYRSASNVTRQNASALANDFGLRQDINPLTGQGNWTQLLIDAIHKSVGMTDGQRNQLALDIFGKQYGGRLAPLFSSQASSLLDEVMGKTPAGPGRGPITPGATRGSLDRELGIQIDQTRKQLDQLVNGLQRMGSALATSGALFPLGIALHAAVIGLNALAAPLELFSQLPGWAKDATSTLLELRLAMLFFSRTRFGSTTPGITRLPGFRPSEATLARGELAIGTRTAMDAVQADIQASTAKQLRNGATLAEMGQQKAALEAEIGDAEQATVGQLERVNVISAKMVALQREQARLELERTDQMRALQGLQEQQIGLTATNRNRRFSDPQVLALRDQTAVGTEAETAAASGAGAVGLGGLAKTRLAYMLRRDALATEEFVVAEREVAAAAEADAAVTDAAAIETEAQTTVLAAARTSWGAFAGRLGGMAAAVDPLLVGLVAFPLVLSAFDSAAQQASSAAEAARRALGEPAGDLNNLNRQILLLGEAAKKQANARWGNGNQQSRLPGPLGSAENFLTNNVMSAAQNLLGDSPGDPQATRNLQTSARSLVGHYESYVNALKQEGPALIKTESGRRQLAHLMDELTRAARAGATTTFAGHPEAMAHAIKDFETALHQEYEGLVVANASRVRGSQPQVFSTVASISAKTAQQYLQSLDDYSKVFGTQNNSLHEAAQFYAALADKYRTSTGNDTAMQALYSSQQSFVNAVNKNVQDLMHAATAAPTAGGALGDLHSAEATINNGRSQIMSGFGQAIAYAKATGQSAKSIKLLQDAEHQVIMQLSDLQATVVQQILDTVKSQAAVATSEIQGVSPEADLARAQSTLTGIQQQLAAARANGARASVINDLVAQANNQQNAVAKQQIDNARNVEQAQGQLAQSSITGISPQADIARAQAAITTARNNLAFDRAHGAGQAAIITDQASLYAAEYALNQQLQQRDQQVATDAKALIDAQAAYAESQTTNPVTQAREALAAAQRDLTVIRPQDYKTYQEYQTAVLNQKAAAGQAVQALRSAIVQQDERTLKFELDTLRITDQQYINGLQKLLKMRHLSLQDRQTIMEDIFAVTQQTAVNLNTGNIKMPTTYQVKSAIQAAMHGRRAAAAAGSAAIIQNNSNTNTVNLYVHKDADLAKLARVLDATLGGSVQAAAQAAGVI